MGSPAVGIANRTSITSAMPGAPPSQMNGTRQDDVSSSLETEDMVNPVLLWLRFFSRARQASIRILVVDDDPVARKLCKRLLSNCGYQLVTEADCGARALELVNSCANEPDKQFQVILIDVYMPDMGGLELLCQLRSLSHCRSVPVISTLECDSLVSSAEDIQTAYSCLSKGADDYIIKPVRSEVLRNMWSNVWKKKREQKVESELNEERQKRLEKDSEVSELETLIAALKADVDLAVETPVAAILKTLARLQMEEGLSEEVQGALSSIVKSLSSSDLYLPAFHKMILSKPGSEGDGEGGLLDLDDKTRSWLAQEIGSSIVESTSLCPDKVIWSKETDSTKKADLRRLDFNAFESSPDEMLPLIVEMFKDFKLLKRFHIDENAFHTYLLDMRRNYLASNPYHNFTHAFDVTQLIYAILTTCKAADALSYTDIFALLLSGISHDVKHPGLSNQFLILRRHELAMRYNDTSVLENFHASVAMEMIRNCHLLDNLEENVEREIRASMIKCILATDMARHHEILSRFSAIQEFSREDPAHRSLLMKMIIKTADISNPARPFPICKEWAEHIQEEFCRQGDKEKGFGMPVSPFYDRLDLNLPKFQTGFIDFFVFGLFDSLQKEIPLLEPMVNQLVRNREMWEERGKAGLLKPDPSPAGVLSS